MNSFFDIKEVRTTRSTAEVNECLLKGWQILSMHTSCLDPVNAPNHLEQNFTLGRPKETQEKK